MERLAKDKRSSLLQNFVTYNCKRFYNIGPRKLDRTVDERERELKENVLKLQAEKVNKEKVGPSMAYLFLDEWSFHLRFFLFTFYLNGATCPKIIFCVGVIMNNQA